MRSRYSTAWIRSCISRYPRSVGSSLRSLAAIRITPGLSQSMGAASITTPGSTQDGSGGPTRPVAPASVRRRFVGRCAGTWAAAVGVGEVVGPGQLRGAENPAGVADHVGVGGQGGYSAADEQWRLRVGEVHVLRCPEDRLGADQARVEGDRGDAVRAELVGHAGDHVVGRRLRRAVRNSGVDLL